MRQPEPDRDAALAMRVPIAWKRRLKVAAAEQGVTMTQLVMAAVEAWIAQGGKSEKGGG